MSQMSSPIHYLASFSSPILSTLAAVKHRSLAAILVDTVISDSWGIARFWCSRIFQVHKKLFSNICLKNFHVNFIYLSVTVVFRGNLLYRTIIFLMLTAHADLLNLSNLAVKMVMAEWETFQQLHYHKFWTIRSIMPSFFGPRERLLPEWWQLQDLR